MQSFGRIFLVLFSLAAGGTVLAASDEAVEERRFPFAAGSTLRVDTFTGGIRVTPTDEAQIRVVVHKEPTGHRPDDARRWVQQVHVSMHQTGDTLEVITRYRGPSVHLTLVDRPEGGLRVELFVPRSGCHLDLTTRDGSIDVGPEHTGNVRARAESGEIVLGRIDGHVDAQIDTGDLQLSRALGDATLRATRGNLTVGTVFGRATLRADSGDIEILSARGGLEARAVAGDVKAGFARSVPAASRITVSGGNITAALDPATNLEIDASSLWGRVEAHLLGPLQTRRNRRSHLAGRLNAGGPLLTLHASGGHVKVEGVPDPSPGF